MNAPAIASTHRTQKLTTPRQAMLVESEIADADACHANEPLELEHPRVLW